MSMKFFTGLQDLLGLYDSATSAPSTSSPSTSIPPTTLFVASQLPRSPTNIIQEINSRSSDEDGPIQKCSHDRVVRFVDSLVTGYSEAPRSPFTADTGVNFEKKSRGAPEPAEILEEYRRSCERHHVRPNPAVIRQIGFMHRTPDVRQELLSLRGERVSVADMESLEVVFSRVQFDSLDFEYTFLEDDAIVTLAEMIEFYDSAVKLNLSFNRQINQRGWSAVFRAVRNCASLTVLNLRYTSVEGSMVSLSKCLKAPAPALTCLHLENITLSGKSLLMLVSALKSNTVLKELYLGDNSLQSTDGTHLYQLILCNTGLQMLDLRNNQLSDNGLKHICDALRNAETLAHSALTTLVLWNNNITSASMGTLCMALDENHHLDTLNIGCNPLGVTGIQLLKPALAKTTHLHRLGLQQTGMDCEAAIILAECLADNSAIVRVDLRENPRIGSAGLLALHSAMKMNSTITSMNLDLTCTEAVSEKEEFRRYYEEIRQMCERNKQAALSRMNAKTEDIPPATVDCAAQTASPPKSPCCAAGTSAEAPCEPTCKRTQRPNRFCRSSSLTCTETVDDIHERIKEMSGSSLSLDGSTTNSAATRTIRRFNVTTNSSLGKVEWGSLPAIPQAVSQEAAAPAPVVRKLRRFSVSPASSVTDLSTPKLNVERPASLAIACPNTKLADLTPSSISAPLGIPASLDLWSAQKSRSPCPTVVEHISPTVETAASDPIVPPPKKKHHSKCCSRKAEKERQELEADVAAVVADIVNYVVYEESSVVERKASILLGAVSSPDLSILLAGAQTPSSVPSTPSTPSRLLDVVSECSQQEDDEEVVKSVVRRLVRQVLQQEKDALRSTLERRRRQLASSMGSSPL